MDIRDADESSMMDDYKDLAEFLSKDQPTTNVLHYLHAAEILHDQDRLRWMLKQALSKKNISVVRNLAKLRLPCLYYVDEEKKAIEAAFDANFPAACEVFFAYFNIGGSTLADVETHYMLALQLGHLETVRRFLEHEPRLEMNSLVSPVRIAVKNFHAEVLELLLKHNCPVNYRDPATGDSLLHTICEQLAGDVEPQKFQPMLKTLRVLLTNRRMSQHELMVRCHVGKTPILHLLDRHDIKHKETLRHQLLALKELVQANKAVVQHRHNVTHETALHYACDESRFAYFPKNEEGAEIVKLLLRHGADPNALDQYDKSPLEDACCSLNPRIVKALLQGGAQTHPDRIRLRFQFGYFSGQRRARRLLPTWEVTQNLSSIVAMLDKEAHYRLEGPEFVSMLGFLNDWDLEIEDEDLHGPPESIYKFFIRHWPNTEIDLSWEKFLYPILGEYRVMLSHGVYQDKKLVTFYDNLMTETLDTYEDSTFNPSEEFLEQLEDEWDLAERTPLVPGVTVRHIVCSRPERLKESLLLLSPRRSWRKTLWSLQFREKFPILHKVVLGQINRCAIADYTRSSALQVLLSMRQDSLPILAGKMIIEKLGVEDMLNLCAAQLLPANSAGSPRNYEYEQFARVYRSENMLVTCIWPSIVWFILNSEK
ncbi:unnamed protein product [Trichogramma brassicae]|uniref:Uncharacterized protein n=1 Tax=Trichogramma brassicae TaxID=86971 RepID=A0A6H5IGP8_9HYME|nr:unnamed protein product [Trichogramma brassicae]